MATVALRFSMYAEQWKHRQVVIEEYLVLPGFLVMAVIASAPLLTIVRVVFRVAIIAGA